MSTTPTDPARGILDGLVVLLDQVDIPCEQVQLLVLGTIIATKKLTYMDVAARGLISNQMRAAIDAHMVARLRDAES